VANYLEDILLEVSALFLPWRDKLAVQFGYLAQFRLVIWRKIGYKKGCPS
jgi:hypothetical protein